MRNFTAHIKNNKTGETRPLHLMAKTIQEALISSSELSFRDESVLQVIEQGDW